MIQRHPGQRGQGHFASLAALADQLEPMVSLGVVANANLTRCANLALTSVPPMNGLISLRLALFAVSDQKWIGANIGSQYRKEEASSG
jgi:hypothetical protein